MVGVTRKSHCRDESKEDGEGTLEDEDPSPSRLATATVKFNNPSCQKATEGTSKRCGGEEGRDPASH